MPAPEYPPHNRLKVLVAYWYVRTCIREGVRPCGGGCGLGQSEFEAILGFFIAHGVLDVTLSSRHESRFDTHMEFVSEREYQLAVDDEAKRAGAPPRGERH